MYNLSIIMSAIAELLFSVWINFAVYTSIIGLSIFFLAIIMWISSFVILYSWRKSHLQDYHYLQDGNSLCNKIVTTARHL